MSSTMPSRTQTLYFLAPPSLAVGFVSSWLQEGCQCSCHLVHFKKWQK